MSARAWIFAPLALLGLAAAAPATTGKPRLPVVIDARPSFRPEQVAGVRLGGVRRARCGRSRRRTRPCAVVEVGLRLRGASGPRRVRLRYPLRKGFTRRIREELGPRAEAFLRELVRALAPRLRRRPADLRRAVRRVCREISHELDLRHYRADPRVRLSETVRSRLSRIARRYFLQTGKPLRVLSGSRSPEDQARAMYTKLRAGARMVRVYRDKKAIGEIVRAYRRASHARRPREEVIASMADVIHGQIRRGIYISRHLLAGAVDLRSRRMSRRDKRALLRAVRGVRRASVIEEVHPPHFHLELR